MAGNAGMGRPKGSLNRRTASLMALVETGESPAAFGLRVMRDESQPIEVRLAGAKLVAPLVHPRPVPAGETVTIDLPDASTPDGILQASGAIMKAVAEGEVTVSTGRDLMAMLDSHRQCIQLLSAQTAPADRSHGLGRAQGR